MKQYIEIGFEALKEMKIEDVLKIETQLNKTGGLKTNGTTNIERSSIKF